MSIVANRQARSRRSHVRSIRVLAPCNGAGQEAVIRITQDGQADDYRLGHLAADFGAGFLLEKIGSEAGETYHVNLNGRESSCTCPGHTYAGYCKHVDGLAALDKAGKLPRRPATGLCPWCQERPEKCGCHNPGQDGDYAGYPDAEPLTAQDLDAMAAYYGE
jgi:hypothetical protein